MVITRKWKVCITFREVFMEITESENNGKTIVRCSGRLDAISSPQLEGFVNEHITQGKKKILLDLSQVEYLSSSGMRFLLSMTKRLSAEQGFFGIFGIHEDVMEIIRMAGFENILRIFADENAAVSAA